MSLETSTRFKEKIVIWDQHQAMIIRKALFDYLRKTERLKPNDLGEQMSIVRVLHKVDDGIKRTA